MIETDKELSAIREYLLHRAGGKGRQEFEERFLTDPEFRELALAVEGELIDDYLAGRLSPGEQSDFVNHYLSGPRQVEELKLARSLRDGALEERARGQARAPEVVTTKGWLHRFADLLNGKGWLTALAFAVVLCIAAVVLWRQPGMWRWGNQQAALNAEVALLNEHSAGEEPPLAVRLNSGLSRGPEQVPKLTVPDGVNVVLFSLGLPGRPYESYEVTLRVNDGPVAFTVSGFGAEEAGRERLLKVRVPAHVLEPNDYIMSVRGIDSGRAEEIADYFFRVVR